MAGKAVCTAEGLQIGVYKSSWAALAADSFLMHEQKMRLFCM